VDASHPKVRELRDLTAWCEGMVWSSPERHGAMTGVMKTQTDWIPLSEGAVRPTQGKTLAVMQVSGGSQSFNAVNQMRVLGRWMRMLTIPNQSAIPKAFQEFDQSGRMRLSPLYDRILDVMEELMKFTLLTRDRAEYLMDRYSERKESAEALMKRVNLSAATWGAAQGAFQGHGRPQRVRDRAIFQDVAVQQIKASVRLGAVHEDLVADQRQLRRRILAHRLQPNLGPAELEMQHRRQTLDALQHAGGQRGQQQFHRVHRIAPPGEIGIERDFCLLRHGKTAMCVDPAGVDAVFHPSSFPISSAVSTLPVETTFSSTTSPGVDITP
jgi:NAD(P)H-dependent FMN reductase